MIKNPAPLLIIAGLVVVIAYVSFFAVSGTVDLHYPVENGQEGYCVEGQTRDCAVGACNGTSTCVNSRWGGCKWKTLCTPGTKAPCLEHGCAYAYKECNECGTGYGPCAE